MPAAILRWSALCLLLATTAPARAEENILGLPTPKDPRHPGAVLLFGGGGLTDEAFDRFLALAGGPQARIVIVPSAGFRRRDYDTDEQFTADLKSRFSYWVRLPARGRAASVEFLATDDPKDADVAAFVRPLTTATGVWFSGGQQTRLTYRFAGQTPKQTRFQIALRAVLERGGIVGGTSAGMAALPEIMTAYQERLGEAGPVTAVAGHGLGLFTGALVEQHFEARGGRLERFTGLLRDDAQLDKLSGRDGVGSRMVGLAVEQGTGLLLQQNHVEVLGGKNAHVFVKSSNGTVLTWHTLKAGERAELRGGATLVHETPAKP